MGNSVFRQKNIDRLASPDNMHEYLHISSPRLWMVLSAILAILIGLIVYACIVTIENTLPVEATVMNFSEESSAYSFISSNLPEEMEEIIDVDMEFRIDGLEGTVSSVIEESGATVVIAVLNDPSIMLKDGVYNAEIVLERISPSYYVKPKIIDYMRL